MQNITVFGKEYSWDEHAGLEPRAVLGIQGWVKKLAMRFIVRGKALGISLGDLTQAANVGALLAAKTFRPQRGASFSTWATFSIVNEMRHLCKRPWAASLDAPVYDCHGGPALSETIADSAGEQERAEAELELGCMMSRLSLEERKLIAEHFGLGGRLEGRGFAAIGRGMGLSDQTICIRVNKALAKMRRVARRMPLARSLDKA
jgi:RNA polymerase sigma factor (sigma-70 family)